MLATEMEIEVIVVSFGCYHSVLSKLYPTSYYRNIIYVQNILGCKLHRASEASYSIR